MKSVSEQRERIIGLKSEMPKAKDVPDGTIYENLTDGTVNVAYHGTWYEKKNSPVDLPEVNGLPYQEINSVDNGGYHRIQVNCEFSNSKKYYYGFIFVDTTGVEVWTIMLRSDNSSGYGINRLSNSGHGISFNIARKSDTEFVITNEVASTPFRLLLIDYQG